MSDAVAVSPPAAKPLPYSPVRNLMLYLTEDCNLRCTYCFVKKKPRRMTSETARKTVEFLLSRLVSGAEYQVNITFFGGEPFMEPERMEEVIGAAREPRPNVAKKVTFAATTNATIATPRVERIIRDSQMALLISLDGSHDANLSRPFVSGKPSYEVVARNIPKLVSWSPNVMGRMTFHPGNLDLVGNVRDVVALGIPCVALCPVVEADWNGYEAALEKAYQELADFYIETFRAGKLPPLEVTHTLLRDYHQHRNGRGRPSRPCAVGASTLAVDPDGHVMPCHRFIYRSKEWLGTVDAPQLEKRAPYLHLSSRDFLGCDTCVAEPMCGGGCRVVALNAGYNLAEAHPNYCLLTRAHARAVVRIYDTLTAERNPHFTRMLRGASMLPAAMGELILS